MEVDAATELTSAFTAWCDALPVKSISKANAAKKGFRRDMDITKLLNVVVEDVAKAAISLALARPGRQNIPMRENSSVFRPH